MTPDIVLCNSLHPPATSAIWLCLLSRCLCMFDSWQVSGPDHLCSVSIECAQSFMVSSLSPDSSYRFGFLVLFWASMRLQFSLGFVTVQPVYFGFWIWLRGVISHLVVSTFALASCTFVHVVSTLASTCVRVRRRIGMALGDCSSDGCSRARSIFPFILTTQ